MQNITDKLMSNNELAKFYGVSVRTIQRDPGINCLIRVYLNGRTFFNRAQVVAHFERVVVGEQCNDRCKEALKPQVKPEIQRSFRRKKRTD